MDKRMSFAVNAACLALATALVLYPPGSVPAGVATGIMWGLWGIDPLLGLVIVWLLTACTLRIIIWFLMRRKPAAA